MHSTKASTASRTLRTPLTSLQAQNTLDSLTGKAQVRPCLQQHLLPQQFHSLLRDLLSTAHGSQEVARSASAEQASWRVRLSCTCMASLSAQTCPAPGATYQNSKLIATEPQSSAGAAKYTARACRHTPQCDC